MEVLNDSWMTYESFLEIYHGIMLSTFIGHSSNMNRDDFIVVVTTCPNFFQIHWLLVRSSSNEDSFL